MRALASVRMKLSTCGSGAMPGRLDTVASSLGGGAFTNGAGSPWKKLFQSAWAGAKTASKATAASVWKLLMGASQA